MTRFEYDTSGRLTAVKHALNRYTRFTYDERGNRLSQLDANERATALTYDYLNRLVRKTLPLGQSEAYAHDAAGNLVLKTDAEGRKTRLAYDSMNRLASKDHGDNGTLDVTFTYTASGQRDTVTDGRGATTYAYDEVDRLASVTQPGGTKLEYDYDNSDNQTVSRVRDSGGAVVQEVAKTYDLLNRLATVTDASGETRYAYTAVGSREPVTYPNGTVASYAYSDLNRLTDLANRGPGGAVISSYHYDLGPTGVRLKVTEHGGSTVDYAYDALYRLAGEVRSGMDPYAIGFTYDAVGNRLTRVRDGDATGYVYDANDRLVAETGPEGVTTYAYDANGSTIAKHAPDGSTIYAYDFEKRLAQAVTPTGTVTYTYDTDGNRVSKTDAAGAVGYAVDSANNTGYAQVVAETGAAGVAVAYTYGDDLLSQTRGGARSFYHYDGLGSTRALTSSAGTATDTYTYEAFGELVASTGSTPNTYMFTGEQYDPNVGFYYLRARYYNPAVGRFVTTDPWQGSVYDPASLHRYLYCGSEPVNHLDPSGRLTILQWVGVVFLVALFAVMVYGVMLAVPSRGAVLRLDFTAFTLAGVLLANGTAPNETEIKTAVLRMVRDKFAPAGVTVELGKPLSPTESSVGFENTSGMARDPDGTARGVMFGADRAGQPHGSVYVGTFAEPEFRGKFTQEGLAKAIAFVVAHEAGRTYFCGHDGGPRNIMAPSVVPPGEGTGRQGAATIDDIVEWLTIDREFMDKYVERIRQKK